MLQQKLENKVHNLLKIKENVDIHPPVQALPIQQQTFNNASISPEINVVELINKQTEMILAIIRELTINQNLILQKLSDVKPQSTTQQDFREKIITLRYDDKGNPIGANITLKQNAEEMLDLDELEKSGLAQDIEIT